ncbi:hypothetical protein [Agromyces neolithicus]|uniref:hypothetical protein n=1 Tax=Agromyces neolithicus TaxID=269420 RepID=UPI0031D8EA80
MVPITGGRLSVEREAETPIELVQVAGVSYLGQAGTSHDVVNLSRGLVVFVEVELKSAGEGVRDSSAVS